MSQFLPTVKTGGFLGLLFVIYPGRPGGRLGASCMRGLGHLAGQSHGPYPFFRGYFYAFLWGRLFSDVRPEGMVETVLFPAQAVADLRAAAAFLPAGPGMLLPRLCLHKGFPGDGHHLPACVRQVHPVKGMRVFLAEDVPGAVDVGVQGTAVGRPVQAPADPFPGENSLFCTLLSICGDWVPVQQACLAGVAFFPLDNRDPIPGADHLQDGQELCVWDGHKVLVVYPAQFHFLFLLLIVAHNHHFNLVGGTPPHDPVRCFIEEIPDPVLPVTGEGVQRMAVRPGFPRRFPFGKAGNELRPPFVEPLVQGLQVPAPDKDRLRPCVGEPRQEVPYPHIQAEEPPGASRQCRSLKAVLIGDAETVSSMEGFYLRPHIFPRDHGCLPDPERLLQVRKDQEKVLLHLPGFTHLVRKGGSGFLLPDITGDARFCPVFGRVLPPVLERLKVSLLGSHGLPDCLLVNLAGTGIVKRILCSPHDCVKHLIPQEPVFHRWVREMLLFFEGGQALLYEDSGFIALQPFLACLGDDLLPGFFVELINMPVCLLDAGKHGMQCLRLIVGTLLRGLAEAGHGIADEEVDTVAQATAAHRIIPEIGYGRICSFDINHHSAHSPFLLSAALNHQAAS